MEIHNIEQLRLGQLIESGELEEAVRIAGGMDFEALEKRVLEIAQRSRMAVEFVQLLLMKEDSFENHRLMCGAYYAGGTLDGYYLAYFHAEEMYRLSPSLETGLNMLRFNSVPGKPMSDDVAFAVVKKLMKEYPDSRELSEMLKRLGSRYYELPDKDD